ncbi:AAA family ATPase [Comamonas piscis]|uniref:AAA family ATPase n=1 Tax=Comamonas piscis TaxID=1562974 RepID=A0A7G5EH12_9BURK|nr:ATP-binding protein [Comamonas piscis]QMV73287.1 AAA family ATPase [Comamonas piscis]WSO36086.1 AAA family ATPase [Comamonas piscis]
MATVEAEHQRFIEHLAATSSPANVQRFAELVHQNLDALADVGIARRARSVKLAPIVIDGMRLPLQVKPVVRPIGQAVLQAFKLTGLKVGPFRGFMAQETFDLSRDITLVYGPNGSGKTSFCEALEFAMLGSVGEAKAKRIDQKTYCNNAHVKNHAPPQLTGTLPEGGTFRIQPNEADFRFCFIEKNRLDDFARIAAKTPGDQKLLIATLFGVEQFASFVKGFNTELDGNLMLLGPKAQELAQKKLALTASSQAIEQFELRKAALNEEAIQVAALFDKTKTFAELRVWLRGTVELPGRLAEVTKALDKPRVKISNITAAALQAFFGTVKSTGVQLGQIRTTLQQRAGEVSFSHLYKAVSELANSAVECPACRTPLDRVTVNPFERAEHGMAQLKELSDLQDKAAELKEQLADQAHRLLHAMHSAAIAAKEVAPKDFAAAALPELPVESTGKWMTVWTDDDNRAFNELLKLLGLVETSNQAARDEEAKRILLVQERERLQDLETSIARLEWSFEALKKEFETAQGVISSFDEQNKKLIEEVETENLEVKHHWDVKAAYDEYLTKLKDYLGELPAQLVMGLGAKTTELYNAFNRGDHPNDQLVTLTLPLTENDKILVELAGSPGQRFDALHIFSEGHIRCLGLAILLAKNLEQGCQVVIFDDVVNAIDDEHRDGIWRTFLGEGRLDGKQVILTSHAEEFLMRIQQELGAKMASEISRYHFLPHLGEYQLRVDTTPPSKNYLLVAQDAVVNHQKRDALRDARAALESLTDRIWKWLGKAGDGSIDLKMNRPGAPIELYNKCTKLVAALKKQQLAATHTAAEEMIIGLSGLLGISGQSIEWYYLNAGTHDSTRAHDFDIATVRTIVACLSTLDTSLQKAAKPDKQATNI